MKLEEDKHSNQTIDFKISIDILKLKKSIYRLNFWFWKDTIEFRQGIYNWKGDYLQFIDRWYPCYSIEFEITFEVRACRFDIVEKTFFEISINEPLKIELKEFQKEIQFSIL